MSNIEYFKGYTLHQVNSNPRSDDSDETAVRRMELISGLYVHKPFGQEGITLPVCKYINNKTYKPVYEFDVTADAIGAHPRYGYAKLEGENVVLNNSPILPKYIKGGMVMLNNLMLTCRGKDNLILGNMNKLISTGDVSIIKRYETDDELIGVLVCILKDCILETKTLRFVFEFKKDEEGYTDLITKTYMK